MNIAVLTLTRDRLPYTQHCFQTLADYAGCHYDHYVLDNGSTDGTHQWLREQKANGTVYELIERGDNVGISRGMNMLLDSLDDDYDCIVKFDNDAELVHHDTLRTVCDLAVEGGALLSPTILGLRNPPQPTRELQINGEIILDVPQIGGIFLAAPAWVYDEFRYSESNPVWGVDDGEICAWFRAQGGTCGYVKSLEAWHHETTDGQHDTFPEYFDRRVLEGGPA